MPFARPPASLVAVPPHAPTRAHNGSYNLAIAMQLHDVPALQLGARGK